MAGFGSQLKALRKSAGLTQAQLAERSGIHRVNIVRFETGVTEPTWSSVKALAKALGVSCSAFEVDDEPAAEEQPVKEPTVEPKRKRRERDAE